MHAALLSYCARHGLVSTLKAPVMSSSWGLRLWRIISRCARNNSMSAFQRRRGKLWGQAVDKLCKYRDNLSPATGLVLERALSTELPQVHPWGVVAVLVAHASLPLAKKQMLWDTHANPRDNHLSPRRSAHAPEGEPQHPDSAHDHRRPSARLYLQGELKLT